MNIINKNLIDVKKNEWVIEEIINKGGFGSIYNIKKKFNFIDDKKYIVKIEPYENGTLFVEINFYIRYCNINKINDWKLKNNINNLGILTYISHGIINDIVLNNKYRFLILEKYDCTLQDILDKVTDEKKYNICNQLVDSLKYIHDKNYVHCDIKPENIFFTKNDNFKQAYLADYGLITKEIIDIKVSKKYKNNGTKVYMSKDAHKGILTKIGDLESLLYNIIYYLYRNLPWLYEKNSKKIETLKTSFLNNPKQYFELFYKINIPNNLLNYINYLNTFKKNEKINYNGLKIYLK